MWKHIGACRFVWNYMLDYQNSHYEHTKEHLLGYDMIKLLTPLKKDSEYNWLNEISNTSLQVVCRDLDKAYNGFFKKTKGFPKYKSKKKSKLSFPIRPDSLYFKNESVLNIEKIGKVKYKTDFCFSYGRNKHNFYNSRVSYKNGKWMLSFCMECENQAHELTDKSMGIDLGVKQLAAVAFGNDDPLFFDNINKSKKMRDLEKRIKYLQRSVSRKYEANRTGNVYHKTNNIIRLEEKIRKLYEKQANIRRNYINQTTHRLIFMFPKRVIMEDLNISGMLKNKHLSKVIQDQCLYEFIRQMKYKCEWNGIEFIQADRFYPSSKTCSGCGCVMKDLRLRDRIYICPDCGLKIDRDYNAALNLSRYIA